MTYLEVGVRLGESLRLAGPTTKCIGIDPMRSNEQMLKRLEKDRANIQRGGANVHYNNMKQQIEKLYVKPSQLFLDDFISPLNPQKTINWRDIYFLTEADPSINTQADA